MERKATEKRKQPPSHSRCCTDLRLIGAAEGNRAATNVRYGPGFQARPQSRILVWRKKYFSPCNQGNRDPHYGK
jgi:hypothetical protein